MRHGSLFSGIGGFDLAAEWMGWENIFHCEWMPFPKKVLNYYWPNAKTYEDITKTDFTIHRGTIDILTGGFPCQPYSSAGKRLGKEDERHLWPHMLRVISEVKPTYVVGENVRGLTNWSGGLVFEEVCADLESQGYEVQPVLLPACAVGAPHRRDRIWFIAYSNNSPAKHAIPTGWDLSTSQTYSGTATNSNSNTRRSANCNWQNKGEHIFSRSSRFSEERTTTDTDSIRQHERECDNEEFASERGINAFNDINQSIQNWQRFPTQSPICGGDDGLPTELDGITFSKWRNESIKGYGNAIVPQVAYQIFKVISEMDKNKNQLTIFDIDKTN